MKRSRFPARAILSTWDAADVRRRFRQGLAAGLAGWQGRTTMAIALVVMAVVGVGAAAYAGVPRAVPVKAVRVDVIGDSLSTGYKTPGNTWPGQAQRLVSAMGLAAEITNASENGAGYVQPGDMGDVFLDLVNRIVNSQSQVVVVFGSDNDVGNTGLSAAVEGALARIRILAPQAAIVVVGPTSESNDPGGQLTPVRQALAVQAAAIGARFVDPVALGWFQGSASQDLSSDLEHPNAAGETYLARHMSALMAPAIRSAMRRDRLRG
ncbi:SGNH/GDSL hydrolase family protein [Arthrobacter dokdonensis]|uniref:SGNH/GDSL hydrolase family protein n=1 Tax=Arthrobacter dokdonellae TaxID=2211210 RepID=UPI001494E837|nr:SGNH/GDSL hydrolase family protein [Arthrobacter dokdonellae]